MTVALERIDRYLPLDDLVTRSEGGERIIDAYAAVFDQPQEIRDRQGHYIETIAPTAFDRTIAQRAGKFQVIFNHGKDLYGNPAERFTMPYGVPLSVKADGKGLLTSTQISRTPLGDEIYQLAQDGAITGQSFSGATVETDKQPAIQRGGLPRWTRLEIAVSEYGLTPFPTYMGAEVLAVRANLHTLDIEDLIAYLADLPAEERAQVERSLAPADPGTGTVDPADPGTEDTSSRRSAIRRADLRSVRRTLASLQRS